MNAPEYILSKQIEWARNNDIELAGGGENGKGGSAYASTLARNLFESNDSQ